MKTKFVYTKSRLITLAIVSTLLFACSDKTPDQEKPKTREELIKQGLPWLKDSGTTTDMTPVDLTLIDKRKHAKGHTLRFRIPKAYLSSKGLWKGGEVNGSIQIQTGLPHMLPRKAAVRLTQSKSDIGYQAERERLHNGVYIYIYDKLSYPHFVENYRKSYKAHKGYQKQKDNVYGLEFYRKFACSDVRRTPEGKLYKVEEYCVEKSHEYFLTPAGSSPDLRFRCLRNEVNPVGGCGVSAIYKGFSMDYMFRRSQLHRWQEFDRAVRALLDRFVVEQD